MSISITEKEFLIDALLDTKRKGHRAEINLRFQGEDADADGVASKTKSLSKQIDELIAQCMRQWQGAAATIISTLKNSNTKLQASIYSIKKKKRVAQNVVKTVGYLDEAIETATKLLA